MDGKTKLSITATSAIIFSLTVACVTANSWTAEGSPLHTYRMEETSSGMNFLPTLVNDFTYNTEKGYFLNFSGVNGRGEGILAPKTIIQTCADSCWSDTCDITCYELTCRRCPVTEYDTCWFTFCSTC